MSPRSFWTILLKLLGVYIMISGLMAIPSFINLTGIFYANAFSPDAVQPRFYAFAYLFLLLGIFVLVTWGCLVKTDWIIDRLRLNNGIAEEKLNFNMHRSDILKIVIMIIGGVTLMDALPAACQEFLMCLQRMNQYAGFRQDPKSTYLLFHILKTGIGIFMLTSPRLIVNFIERKRRQPNIDTVTE